MDLFSAHTERKLEREQPARRWPASLSLRLGLRAGRTRLLRDEHRGPLRVQRAFHPEADGSAHVVILHPPAGLVGGDALEIAVSVEAGARALLTTTGAGKAYRSAGETASSRTRIDVAAGADCEHVPQETLIFDGADALLSTRVRLEPGARFLGWEVVCLGRPACGERFTRGVLRQAFELERDGRRCFVERGRVDGSDAMLEGAWGLGGRPAFGTLVATEGEPEALRALLAASPQAADPQARVAVTRVAELTVVRALGRDGAQVRALLEAARHAIRDAWGRARVDPAIWRS